MASKASASNASRIQAQEKASKTKSKMYMGFRAEIEQVALSEKAPCPGQPLVRGRSRKPAKASWTGQSRTGLAVCGGGPV